MHVRSITEVIKPLNFTLNREKDEGGGGIIIGDRPSNGMKETQAVHCYKLLSAQEKKVNFCHFIVNVCLL